MRIRDPHFRITAVALWFAWLLVGIAIMAVPYRALAHAILVDSTPQANATIDGPNASILLRFNARIDQARSSLVLDRPDGHRQNLTTDPHAKPNVLQAKAAQLQKGHYALRWQVLASDGHVTRGTLPFAVR